MNEKQILKCMEQLGMTRDEAIALLQEDAEIDRMTSVKEINGDLTKEQQKVAKEAKSAGKKPTVYKFDTSKRKRKENTSKRNLIEVVRSALENAGCSEIKIPNIEREIVFQADGVKYKIVLSAPRT